LRHNIRSITLVELLVSLMLMGAMILSFTGLETFSHERVLGADRRTKVQNSLSFCLDTMSKAVLQASGNAANPAIKLYPDAGAKSGFQVRVDQNTPPTPDDFSDDTWVHFFLSGNQLITGSPTTTDEVLSSKIVANFSNSVMPDSPAGFGFYAYIDVAGAEGNFIEMGLVGRYLPDQDPAVAIRLVNPQVAMKTKAYCNNSSTN